MNDQPSQAAAPNGPPNHPSEPADAYGVFCASIDQNTAQKTANLLALFSQRKPQVERLHILFQTSGGTVADSIFIYNLFKSCPFDILIYNCGSVYSAGVIAFLGAKRRIVSRLATFMLHRPQSPLQAVGLDRLESTVHSLKIDELRVEEILRTHLKLSVDDWANLRNNEFWFTGEDAVKNGIAHEIGEFAPPKGQQILSFNL